VDVAGARQKLGWPHPAFQLPAAVIEGWRNAGAKGGQHYKRWTERHGGHARRAEFDRRVAGDLPESFAATIEAVKRAASSEAPKLATRQSSQKVLEAMAPTLPELLGGSADLTGSNNTKAKDMAPVTAANYGGRYIYYGVREHGMAAAMNGIALHRGFIPYGGTFLVFTDYCRPAIRLSALMGQRVVYVMTHDSIGLGEDGPTHQPVEHLASLRAIPNLLVMRPCDTVETAECWALALAERNRPSVIALTRQAVPTLRTEHRAENLSAKGGYVISEARSPRQVTLISTGSEVSIAVEAQAQLEAAGIGTAVVSLPCWALFDAQSASYREQVLGASALRVAIEAATTFGWERYIGAGGAAIGMVGFGASAPAGDLYKHFGITAEAVVRTVRAKL
jgi:transketolase